LILDFQIEPGVPEQNRPGVVWAVGDGHAQYAELRIARPRILTKRFGI